MVPTHALIRSLGLALFAALVTSGSVLAQGMLVFNQPVRGQIAPGAVESHTFTAQAGQVISLQAQTAGTLDPVLALLNADGETLISDDDFAFPESSDALLQAITLPYTGPYTAQVSGFGDSAGEYTLTLTEGYGVIETADGLSGTDWSPFTDLMEITASSGSLSTTITGVRTIDAAFGAEARSADVAAFVDVQSIRNSSGWITGLAVRGDDEGYVALQISSDGLWRFVRAAGGEETVVRDWTAHPALVAGESSFRMGVFAKGSAYDFFYNGAYIGSASESEFEGGSTVGLVTGTLSSLTSTTEAVYGALVITRPLLLDGEIPIPQQVIVGGGTAMAQNLARRHVVQGDGQMALTVPEASVTYIRPGVNRLMLGQSVEFADFAYGGTVTINQAIRGPAGCGLVLRFAGEEQYALAYVDGSGGFGLSVRDGESYTPGLFGEDTTLAGSATHHLLVIARGQDLFYYLDGRSVGRLETTLTAGEVGTAVVNFEAIDTSCNFRNLWLWSWE